MASQFISKLIANFIEIQFIFIIATLSSAELPEAFERKIKDYRDQGILETTNFEVEYYTSPSSSKNNKQCEYVPPIRCEKNKVYLSYPPHSTASPYLRGLTTSLNLLYSPSFSTHGTSLRHTYNLNAFYHSYFLPTCQVAKIHSKASLRPLIVYVWQLVS
ncbi:hypothetical protein [Helicobacter suis]